MPATSSPPRPPPTPTRAVVALGASAGGLAAFEEFFQNLPAVFPAELAFVLVQHLSPDHPSLLTELLRRFTTLPVVEVTDGLAVASGQVYVLPPGRDLSIVDGALHLLEPVNERGLRSPIDHFFTSLARDQREHAIGIVLSGTGSDGAAGVRVLKAHGGMVMAQRPDTTEFRGMPEAALATGLVDFELAPSDMPTRLLAYVSRTHDGSDPTRASGDEALTLAKVLGVLRDRTTHDFSHYKASTIRRRIERRMAIHQLPSLAEYLKYLRASSTEVDALFHDLLIGVTSFFRDPDAFRVLEDEVLPGLFDEAGEHAQVRVWCAACSTGEEAYSLAILLHERATELGRRGRVQVFATDIDPRAIAVARAGSYPATIAADLPAKRLARHFTLEADGGYRVRKDLRELVVFSVQDLNQDPPFSRLHLVSCRNLLIYLDLGLQQRLMAVFHYALRPGGALFLGTSETVGPGVGLFTPLHPSAKLYRRSADLRDTTQLVLDRVVSGLRSTQPRAHAAPLREVTEQAVLRQAVPAAALVDADGVVLFLHGRMGAYLELPAGEVRASNALTMAQEPLREPLAATLARAVATGEVARSARVSLQGPGGPTVELEVHPITPGPRSPPLFLVALRPADEAPPTVPLAADGADRGARELFLAVTNERLQATVEDFGSANEELQSVNEELQSANEELETSKEELLSLNEELVTVNTELQVESAALTEANRDLTTLLQSTGVGTVLLDRDLKIVRFTAAATRIIHLIASDAGRPLAHVATELEGYDRLLADTAAVLDSLIPLELEVKVRSGTWYLLRIHPNRTSGEVDGVSLTFVDVTEVVRVRNALLRDAGVQPNG